MSGEQKNLISEYARKMTTAVYNEVDVEVIAARSYILGRVGKRSDSMTIELCNLFQQSLYEFCLRAKTGTNNSRKRYSSPKNVYAKKIEAKSIRDLIKEDESGDK